VPSTRQTAKATTKERIVEASADLLRRQGYAATGVKQIVEAARAPFGSLYHFFPGGKEELGAAAIRRSGLLYAQLLPAVFDPAPDLATGVRDFFAAAAYTLRQSDYADACPIATVALEASSTSKPLRRACAEVFDAWIAAGTDRFVAEGLDQPEARRLVTAMISALEGAFVLCRALRSTEPMEHAGSLVSEVVRASLAYRRDNPRV
jgi:AcrR family transcriptional regulator